MANFAIVRTRYYKHDAAIRVLDHAHSMRNGFTKSANVHNEFSKANAGLYVGKCESSLDAYQAQRERHTKLKGKKPRSDMNTLFEHVVVLSVGQFEKLELEYGAAKAKKMILSSLNDYAQSIKNEFGFAICGLDLHLDEGVIQEDGTIKRNVHAHVMFYNFDFKNEVAPLRGLMIRGKNPETGKTNELNPNFERMQDLVAGSFESLGFVRGESQGIENVEHKTKAQYVKSELSKKENELKLLQNQIQKQEIELRSLVGKYETAKIYGIKALKRSLEQISLAMLNLGREINEDGVQRFQECLRVYDKEVKEYEIPEQSIAEVEKVLSPLRPKGNYQN